MRRSRWRRAAASLAAGLALAVALAGCVTAPQAAPGGVIRIGVAEPGLPLVPENADDPLVARILPALTAGLVHVDPDGAVELELAKAITTSDSRVFEVAIDEFADFSDGEPVTAASFVEAWRRAALPGSGHPDRLAFWPIAGYVSETAAATAVEEAEAEGREPDPALGDLVAAGGLTVVDDEHFRITLRDPRPEFPAELARPGFLPLPALAFDDPEAFAANPVGAGPYRFAGPDAWHPGDRLELEPNPGYSGLREAQNAGISLRFFDDARVAVAELLAGELDVVERLPAGSAAAFDDRLDGRIASHALPQLYTLVIPAGLQRMQGEEGRLRRAALAMSIDRSRLSDEVLGGDATPALDFLSSDFLPQAAEPQPEPDGSPSAAPEPAPTVTPGPGGAVTGRLSPSDFDFPWLARANDFIADRWWDEAGEFAAWQDTVTIVVVNDTVEELIAESIASRFSAALNIDAVVLRFPNAEELEAQVAEDGLPVFRIARTEFPTAAVSQALATVVPSGFMPQAASDRLWEADHAVDRLEARRLGLLAQLELAEALPVIPIISPAASAGYADGVSGVELGWTGALDFSRIAPEP